MHPVPGVTAKATSTRRQVSGDVPASEIIARGSVCRPIGSGRMPKDRRQIREGLPPLRQLLSLARRSGKHRVGIRSPTLAVPSGKATTLDADSEPLDGSGRLGRWTRRRSTCHFRTLNVGTWWMESPAPKTARGREDQAQDKERWDDVPSKIRRGVGGAHKSD